jgi:pilus assembly protein Flp/PilA
MKKIAACILKEEDGQGLVEYTLILALIVLAAVAAVSFLGENAFALYQDSMDKMSP